ncbi:MAG: hypothetical protein ACREQJ_13010 [Candidatus Binatia bacterium]
MKKILLAVLLLTVAVSAGAADRNLRVVAERIVGGAALMREIDRDRPIDEFYDRARRFADLARGSTGRGDVSEEWRRLRSSYRTARKEARRGREEGWSFLTSHLDEDFAAGDRLIGSVADGPATGTGEARRVSLIRSETCVGRNKTDHACPNRRDTLTFSLPRDVKVIRRFDTEWRDFGANGNGELYINDRLVWREDVNKDWDGDGKDLNLRIPAGSVITLRSANGDPIWVRKLTVDVLEREDRDDYRDPWNLPYDPWR